MAIAGLAAAIASHWWHTSTRVPTVERAIPMEAVVPPLLAVALTWALVETWPQQMETTARSPTVLRAARFAAVLAIGEAAASTAAASVDGTAVRVTAVGVALAGVAAPSLRRWMWMPLVLAGYLWMQHAARHAPGAVLPHGLEIAVLACLLGGSAYAVDLGVIRWSRD